MTELTRLLDVKVYVTPDLVPTCALHFPTGRVCRFLRYECEALGDVPVCMLNNKIVERANHIDDMGYLVPHDDCPVWASEPV